MIENRERYTYRQAAARVKRSVITIKRWRRHGMPMGWHEGMRVVDHATLLKWLRTTIARNDANRRVTGDTPPQLELDAPTLNPPNVMVE
ncbi:MULTISPECIES: hypothetical protein [unclassified Leucobacter]|uniref:hypothetical protein n=1 Tax=unclassified Leucobacter TaxID=2621730 RepID=UPI000621258A|nr:hypothetical protein [Leucobacter sp. Ag1]KKI18726.1 hypothetical protein XM48_10625 [Leucobacter sp. Ag1]